MMRLVFINKHCYSLHISPRKMGTTQSNPPFEKQYLKLLRKKKRQFLAKTSEEHYTRSSAHKLSILSDVGILEVDWKVFVEDFSEQHQDTCFWAAPLLKSLKQMTFVNEKRWVDQIFYMQFSSLVIPPSENGASETEPMKRNTLFKSMLEERMLNASVILGPEFGKPLPMTKKRGDELEFKLLQDNLDRALRDRENPFHVLIRRFQKLFSQRFSSNGLNRTDANFDTRGVDIGATQSPAYRSQEALVNVQYFIKMIVYSLSLFYKSVISSDRLFSLREIIASSLLDIIVSGKVYDSIYRLLTIKHEQDVKNLQEKMRTAKPTMTPKSFGVSSYLALTEDPVKLLQLDPKALIEEIKSVEQLSSSDTEKHAGEPYGEVIEKFREIPLYRTLIRKLNAISELNGVICECVDTFWKGSNVDPEKLTIDADQYLSILLYVIVKSGMGGVYVDIVLAHEMAQMGFRVNYNRYCLTTLMAAFTHLMNKDFNFVAE